MAGEILKKRREELGRDLRDISNILKINCDYLRHIEDDAFDKLPEPVYVKGYIREYAEFLNIDAEDVLKAYTEQVPAPAAENEAVLEEALRGRKTRARTLAISFLLVLFAVIILFLVSPFSPLKEDTSSPPLKRGDEMSKSVAEPAGETQLPETTTLPPSSNSESGRTPQSTTETKKELLPVTDQSPHVLEIIADDITWLAITTDEAAPKEIMMNPGETVKVKANKNIYLKIGNAGGVKLIFNGKGFGKLGDKGEVITVNLPGAGT